MKDNLDANPHVLSGTSRNTHMAAALMANGSHRGTVRRGSTARSSSNGKVGDDTGRRTGSSTGSGGSRGGAAGIVGGSNCSNDSFGTSSSHSNGNSSGHRYTKSSAPPIRDLQDAVEDMEPFLAVTVTRNGPGIV